MSAFAQAIKTVVPEYDAPDAGWVKVRDWGNGRLIRGYVTQEAVDTQGDIIPLEVIAKNFANHGDQIALMYEHSLTERGTVPMGLVVGWRKSVDRIEAIFGVNDGTNLHDEVWADMQKTGLRGGFSVGGSIHKKICNTMGICKLSEVSVVEVSYTKTPANTGARVTGLSALSKTERDELRRTSARMLALIKAHEDASDSHTATTTTASISTSGCGCSNSPSTTKASAEEDKPSPDREDKPMENQAAPAVPETVKKSPEVIAALEQIIAQLKAEMAGQAPSAPPAPQEQEKAMAYSASGIEAVVEKAVEAYMTKQRAAASAPTTPPVAKAEGEHPKPVGTGDQNIGGGADGDGTQTKPKDQTEAYSASAFEAAVEKAVDAKIASMAKAKGGSVDGRSTMTTASKTGAVKLNINGDPTGLIKSLKAANPQLYAQIAGTAIGTPLQVEE